MRRALVGLAVGFAVAGCSKNGSDDTFTPIPEPPLVTISVPADGSAVQQGVDVVISGLVVNDKFGDLTQELPVWTIDGARVCADSTVDAGGNVGCTYRWTAGGESEIKLVVTNPEGDTGTAISNVTVTPNAAPTAEITGPDATRVFYSDQPILFEGVVNDAEDAESDLVASWTSDLDGVLGFGAQPDGSGETAGQATLSQGDHLITLGVTDTTGLTGSDQMQITVGPANTPPECEITAPADHSTFGDNFTIEFDGTATDIDIPYSQLAVEWSSDRQGVLGTSVPDNTGDVTFPFVGLSIDTHVITMTVSDEVGATCVAHITVTIGDGPLVELIDPIEGDVVNEGASVPFEAHVSDLQNLATELTLSWDSNVDGQFSTQGATSAGVARFSYSGLTLGEHVITVTASDLDGFTGSDTHTIRVNSLPSAPVVEILPPTPSSAVDLLASIVVDGSDYEGDLVTYTYKWKKGSVYSGVTTETLPNSLTARGDVWTVEVTSNDPYGAGGTGSASTTIQNGLPTIDTVSLTPDPAYIVDQLTCTANNVVDADGDTVSLAYSWTINGVADPSTSRRLSGSFNRNDDVQCFVTPNDGTADGLAVGSNIVHIINQIPTVVSASVTPLSAVEATTLTCNASGLADGDNDPVVALYDWLINGVSTGVTTQTITGATFDKGDSVSCVVTPNDGLVSGTPVTSNAVTISNTVPSLASTILGPEPAYETTTLNCSPGVLTEPDPADNVTYTASWLVNGSAIAATGTSLTGTSFSRGDEVNCTLTPDDGVATGATVMSNTVTIQNTIPQAATITITPNIATTDSTLTAVLTGWTDADGDPEGYQYSWSINGTVDAGQIASTLPSSEIVRGDRVVVTATPWDGIDTGTPLVSAPKVIGNAAPTISGASITPATGNESSTLTCSAFGAADPDGDTVSFSYEWTVSGVVVAATGNTLDGNSFDNGDTVVCTITPNDGTVDGAPQTSNSVFIGNSAPVMTSVTVTPANAFETTTLTCTPAASDVDLDPISYTYAWTVNGNGAGGNSNTLTGAAFDRDDIVVCTVTPSDGSNVGAPMSSSPLTIKNSTPSATSVSIQPANAFTDTTLTAVVTGWVDADNDTEGYIYVWTVNGTVVSGATTATLDGSHFSRDDVVVVTATPFDGTASGNTLTSPSKIIKNTAPTLASVTITPATAYESSTLTCTLGAASDIDGDAITYTYGWTIDGTAIGVTSNTLTGSNFGKGDVVVCTATPTDGTTAGVTQSSAPVTISNSTPVVTSINITPTTAYETTTLTCNVATSDADGDSVSLTYSWQVNGTTLASSNTQTLTGSKFDRDDSVQCTATPRDVAATGVPVQSAPVVILNSAPSITTASITPAPAYTDSTLTAVPAGWADADGDTPGYTYQWQKNGSNIGGATLSTLTGTNFVKGDSIVVVITPTDGTNAGTPVSSTPLIISNAIPTVTSVSLAPTTAYETSTFSCTPSGGADVDGDTVSYTYAWKVDGATIGATTSTLSGTSFNHGQTVQCVVTPTDGTNAGTAVASNVVTVLNTAPVLSTVTLSPSTAYETSTLTCSHATAVDDDGDSVTYTFRWTVNGTTIGNTTSTLTGSSFVKGNTVRCFVTPNDGQVNGTEVGSATVTILNSAPSITSVSINPSTLFTDTDALAVPAGAFDADGDTVTYTYQWYVNNVAVASGGTSSILSNTKYTKGQTVYVVVTPTDGTTPGNPVQSSTITIQNSLPTAPVVLVSPPDAEPGDALSCGITTASTDADGDTITYSYKWTRNSVLTAYTTSTVPGAATINHDTWACTVTPNDGTGNGATGTDDQYVVDRTAPGAPTLTGLGAYRNERFVNLSGTAEANSSVTITAVCSVSGTRTATTTATGAGTFAYNNFTLSAGDTCTFTAKSTDADGNVSAVSNTVSTTSCSTQDTYDLNYTSGDVCTDPYGLATLSSNPQTSTNVVGNVLDASDTDWYVVTATQQVSAGLNLYHFEVDLTVGAADYAFAIYTDTCTGLNCAVGGLEGPGYNQFDAYATDLGVGGATGHAAPVPANKCTSPSSSTTNNCDALNHTYYIHVWRTSAYSCQSYQLVVQNGRWPAP
jgi:hypothetical protein